MSQQPVPPGEKPRAEPEIIPPGAPDARFEGAAQWSSGTQRVYVARIGPFGFFLIALAVAALAILLLVVAVGAFLLWVPVAAALLAVAALSGLWRRPRSSG